MKEADDDDEDAEESNLNGEACDDDVFAELDIAH